MLSGQSEERVSQQNEESARIVERRDWSVSHQQNVKINPGIIVPVYCPSDGFPEKGT
jgi:hypothetical protein